MFLQVTRSLLLIEQPIHPCVFLFVGAKTSSDIHLLVSAPTTTTVYMSDLSPNFSFVLLTNLLLDLLWDFFPPHKNECVHSKGNSNFWSSSLSNSHATSSLFLLRISSYTKLMYLIITKFIHIFMFITCSIYNSLSECYSFASFLKRRSIFLFYFCRRIEL